MSYPEKFGRGAEKAPPSLNRVKGLSLSVSEILSVQMNKLSQPLLITYTAFSYQQSAVIYIETVLIVEIFIFIDTFSINDTSKCQLTENGNTWYSAPLHVAFF